MAENTPRTKGRAPGYKFDRGGTPTEFGPFIGVVKNNVDPTRQGRLQVYIEQFAGGDPDNQSLWRTVSYCPPYFGATPQIPGTKGDTGSTGTYEKSNPQSYGMWFTPPDLNVSVLCFFVNGDPGLGYYVGCVPDQGMNHMVPAIGSSEKYKVNNEDQKSYYSGAKTLPVTEINPDNSGFVKNPKFYEQEKPVHNFVTALMFQQGTLADIDRGPISSSSQRESPSSCYGISTPGRALYEGGLTAENAESQLKSGNLRPDEVRVVGRRGGHTFVMDDGDITGNNNLIRIRTGLGHQITMSDDGNFFYFIHANGQTWIELGQEGTVDVFSTNSVNVRTQGTINLHADKDINMYAGGKFNLKSVEGTTFETDKTTTINSLEEIKIYSTARIGVLSNGSLAMVSADGSWNGGGSLVFQAGAIDLNGGSTKDVTTPKPLLKFVMPETEFNSSIGWTVSSNGLESIVTRAPTHEPWPFHNKGVDVEIAMEQGQPSPPANAPSIPNGWSGTVKN